MKIRTVQDKDIAMTVLHSVKMNGGYCPCKLDRTPDTRCMCKEFRDFVESGKEGTCHCGLYESYDETKVS